MKPVGFDERWLQPGGVVPVDVQTTWELVREIQRLRSLPPEEELAMPRTDEIKLACGEMTAQELRTVKAVLGWFIRKNSKPQSRAFPTSCPKCGHSTSVHARDQEWKARCLNCNASLDAAKSEDQK